jgi:carbamoyltransferase
MIAQLRPRSWAGYRERGACAPPERLRLQAHDDFAALVDGVVGDLRDGRIVGWYQDRFENGPRALGNRSILIDPANVALARKLSASTKKRAAFRPYALSIAAEDAGRVLTPNGRVFLERWMQVATPVADAAVPRVAAALHVNRTTRPQVCRAEDNPKFHRLLTAWGRASGLAALLNTSFNMSGLPIVSSPAEAMLMFARTDIDTLVLGNFVIRKQD